MAFPVGKIGLFLGQSPIGTPAVLPRKESRIVTDSRQVRPGDVFIAIQGENQDAHDFLTPDLVAKCSYCLVEQGWYSKRPRSGTAFFPVRDTVKAMLRLTEAYLKTLKVKIIAVTGSNGKTTTRTMIASVLRQKYRVFETKGNFNNRIGLPLSVFEMDERTEVAVLEMGTNHFGEIAELSDHVHPQTALITNIGNGHLEFLKNRRGVLKAKMEILSGMSEGSLIVNRDDDLLAKARPLRGIRKMTFGFRKTATCRAHDLSTSLEQGTRFRLASGRRVKLSLPGNGAAYNALAALCVGRLFGVPETRAIQALAAFKAPSHRMEIRTGLGARFILDNYNANPDSLWNALALLQQEKGRARTVAVLGEMAELGKQSRAFHLEAGRRVKMSGCDVLLTLGQRGADIARGAKAAGMKNVFCFMDRAVLAEVIRCSLRNGDRILIKGSHSMKMEEMAETILKGKS